MAIADAGATGHFLLPGAPVTDIKAATAPLIITLPDGKEIKSTHTCLLDTPTFPKAARQAHIVPGLAHTSLISIKALCDAGRQAMYDDNECKISFKGTTIWRGAREPKTGLWVLPLGTPQRPPDHLDLAITQTKPHMANNVYAMTSKEATIKFLHQCLCSPPKSTLLKALQKNQFSTWPGFTKAAVEKCLPTSSPAADKGHMKRQRQGIRSTKPKLTAALEDIKYQRDMHPPLEQEKRNQLFSYVETLDKKDGRVYTDLTGRFPLRSADGMSPCSSCTTGRQMQSWRPQSRMQKTTR